MEIDEDVGGGLVAGGWDRSSQQMILLLLLENNHRWEEMTASNGVQTSNDKPHNESEVECGAL